MAALVLPDEPELVFRQLHHDLHAFASHTMDDDDALAFMTRLLGHESDFLAPVALPPPQSSERQALQREGSVTVAGKRVQVSQRIQQEILQMSDEFKVSEARCLELWFLASDAAKREWIERVDQLPQNAIAGSIPAAARHFLVSEVESKLNLLKELMRLRFDDRLDKRRRQFVLSYTNKLLSEQLLTKLLDACEAQLPKLMEIAPLQQAVSYWHDLVAGCVLFIVSSVRVLPSEIEKLVSVMKALCARLNTVVAKVSPHIVNLTSFSQLFESGSLAGTSPEGVVKQVSCMLRAMTTIQVALLVVFLDKRADRIDRETGDVVAEHPLSAASQASTVRALHRVIFEEQWEQSTFQGVSMLGWAGFLAHQVGDESAAIHNSSSVAAASGNVFAEVEAVPRVVKAALEKQVFTTLSSLLLKYLPDAKHDPLLYRIFERQLESLLINYSSRLMVDVPTVADQAAIAQMQAESDGEIASWEGDCLENIVEFAISLCQRDAQFPRKFWPSEELHSEKLQGDAAGEGDDNCHDFLIACRDVAQKNPSCLAAYLQLVAAAADGVDCAQLAFHHIKQNPAVLSWDHFFAVMNKYQRLLTEAERPANASGANGFALLGASAVSNGASAADSRAGGVGPRFIRPKELEALEAIQSVMQAVVQDQQLALIFFHNHDWSPIQTFVSFLQCRVPSSLKGELMKTLSYFAQVPEVAPFVWRQMDALQILRTTPDAAVYGLEDISYELEHYESMNRRYPATRGFLLLLNELFDSPHAWSSFEGDGRIAAIQFYFDHVLEKVFLKFDLRKYEFDAEKWTLVQSVLAIFKKILRQRHGAASLAEGSLAFQLLQRLLSGSAVLEKLFYILSTDGGVDSLESTATNVHLEHAFFFCLEYAKRQTELTHGAMQFSSDSSSGSSASTRANRRKQLFAKDAAWQLQVGVASPRERCVRYALELLVLVLEKDAQFVNAEATRRSLGGRAQVEMLHSILFRHRADFVNVVQYVKYTKSAYIPHLSVTILRSVSARVAGHALVELLVDSGASGEIMQGYMNRLLNVYDDTHDEDDDEDGTVGVAEHESAAANAPNGAGPVKFQTPKKRRRRSSATTTALSSATAPGTSTSSSAAHAIRAAILDLLLENLSKPAPNVAHLLLGVLNGEATLHRSTGLLHSGLDVVLTLLGTAEFGTETPALAQRCHQIVYRLVSHESSSLAVVPVLEDSRYEFFSTQLHLFNDVYHLKRRRTARDAIAELKMRGWFFKALAVYLHVALQREPPQMKAVNRLMAQLLLSGDRQQRMLLVRLLHESSFELAPPDVPANPQAVALAEQATRAIDADGCLFKWLQIDVERFCETLQSSDLDATTNGSATTSTFKRLRSDLQGGAVSTTDALLQWAIQWNEYSERVAAESHALNSLRELIEVIVLDYLNVPANSDDMDSSAAVWQGLDAIASSEVRVELVNSVASAVLVKLTDRAHNAAPLVEVAAKLLLLLFSELRPSLGAMAASASHRHHSASYVELLLRAVCYTAQATGNAVAAQNARTILYSCIVNVLSAMDDTGASDASELRSATSTSDSLLFALPASLSVSAANVLDLMCRDASEGGDVLSMALAVAGLEAMVVSNGVAVSKLLRERGYLLHFIALFRQLAEMDAALDQETRAAIDSAASNHKSKASALPHGVDASTIGTIYECFLSLFARVASTNEGAVALLEGGLVRALAELRNLPSRRPRLVVPGDNGASASHTSTPQLAALQRAEAVYERKWLPVVRLVSALCATLPQNRTLAQQVLRLMARHRKLFTDCLKLAPHDRPSLSLLREVAHTTFVLRYVSQFEDLVSQEMTVSKWEKITQNVLRIFLLYGSEVTPTLDDDDEQMPDDNSSVWWQRTPPSVASELRDDSVPRLRLSAAMEDALLERGAADVRGLVRLSVFGEAKLYTARMIICNAVAICSNRMLQSVDGGAQLLPGKSVLLAIAGTKKTAASNVFKFPSSDAVDRRSFAASFDPLWSEAPALSEFAVRLGVATNALDAATRVVKELDALTTSVRVSEQDADDLAKLQSLLEYQADSLTFVIENMTIVLLTHLTHYMNHHADVTKSYVQQLLAQVLQTLSSVEGNAFVHALARRLRELATK